MPLAKSNGPIGAAVGAGIGALAGVISKDPGWATIQKIIYRQWNINVSDALAKAIEETEKDVGDKLGAMLLHINDVIEESGGVTKQNILKWTREVRDAFSLIDQGVFTTAQAAEVLDENFASLAAAGTQLSGVLRKDVFELIQLDEQFRTNSAAIQEFKTAMVDQALAGLLMFGEGVTKTRENLDGLSTGLEGDFQDLGDMVQMAFSVMVEQGKPFIQILNDLGPTLDELILLVDEFGFEGSETLEMLLRFREFTKVNEDLMKKIDGARMMMVGLTNAGYLSEQQFDKFGKTTVKQFDQLIERGLTSDEALLMMLPSLIVLKDAAHLYGLEISENTQALIDQATEKGLMGEKAKTVDEKMLAATEVMVEALGVMIELFGGAIPESMKRMMAASDAAAGQVEQDFEDATNEIQRDFDNLHMPNFDTSATVRIRYDDPGFDFRAPNVPNYQHGGIISKPTLAMTGEGGEPEMIGPVGFMSKALEGALSKTGPSQVEREMLDELHGLRGDLKTLPLHLRDAIILTR
jgi:hypothetical protein